MFIIRTGLQGHSKTLNTIIEVDSDAVKRGRKVFYHNITGFQPGHPSIKAEWIPFEDPTRWFELPQNAIIVIDEAQTWFRVRPQGSAVPEFATRLELMRKDGHELHCITQSPKLIDSHMRELCSLHIHYHRGHNGPVVKRWVFQKPELAVNANKLTFSNAEFTRIKIDKSYFGCYESIKEGAGHHFKFRPPRALFTLLACLLIGGGLAYKFYNNRIAPSLAGAEKTHTVVEANQLAPGAAPLVPGVSKTQPMTADEYAQSLLPRFRDIPDSAPVYDSVKAAVSYPKMLCISSSSESLLDRNANQMTMGHYRGKLHGCRCNTQQGNRADISFEACINYVENGRFDPAKPDAMIAQGQARAKDGPGEERAGTSLAGARNGLDKSVTVVSDSEFTSRPWRR